VDLGYWSLAVVVVWRLYKVVDIPGCLAEDTYTFDRMDTYMLLKASSIFLVTVWRRIINSSTNHHLVHQPKNLIVNLHLNTGRSTMQSENRFKVNPRCPHHSDSYRQHWRYDTCIVAALIATQEITAFF